MCLHEFMCIAYVHSGACRGQKRVLDMALEFQIVISYGVGSEIQTWVLWKRTECSHLVSHRFNPEFSVFREYIIMCLTPLSSKALCPRSH